MYSTQVKLVESNRISRNNNSNTIKKSPSVAQQSSWNVCTLLSYSREFEFPFLSALRSSLRRISEGALQISHISLVVNLTGVGATIDTPYIHLQGY